MSADPKPPTDTDSIAREHRADVVVARKGRESRYSMFAAHRVTPEGAFLASALLLELGEELTLELDLGTVTVRTEARVVALDTGAVPGMTVEFAGLAASDRRLLEEQIAQGGKA